MGVDDPLAVAFSAMIQGRARFVESNPGVWEWSEMEINVHGQPYLAGRASDATMAFLAATFLKSVLVRPQRATPEAIAALLRNAEALARCRAQKNRPPHESGLSVGGPAP